MTKVLFIDNFDSFTYNLVDEFEKKGCQVRVYRNNVGIDTIDKVVEGYNPQLIVVSPGPSTPKEAGNSIPIIQKYHPSVPIFGVCLGHQAMVEALGGVVGRAPEIVHGKACFIQHDEKSIYQGVENPMQVGRYHSLAAIELPDCLEVTATYKDIVMGVRHKSLPLEGVQFHPESILTSSGGTLVENLLNQISSHGRLRGAE